ncbi:hypothetical protein JB92DRAFT_1858229 [Gautieria morchelliformis]|nr:hypothetical protein JB92DRAFT_1858229 [Gautieria morchelliformis]
MIFYRGLYEWIPVDIAPATVTRAIPGDGQISFMDGYGSLVAVHFLPPTTPAALETLTFPHELMSESTYQTSVPSNPNEAISGRYRSVPNTSSALATIPPPNDPSVSRLPVLSHTPKLFPSVVGSHSYQIIEGDIEDSEADKYIIPTGSKSFKCIAPVCTVHKNRTLDCPSTCTLKPCNETLHKTKIMARIHLRGHYQKEQRYRCTDW